MKILFFGDSITDASRNRDKHASTSCSALGTGFVMQIAGRLFEKSPTDYQIINQGISGNRIVDLYARVKKDCWNHEPDVISILIGINDIWHELEVQNGVDPERFEKVYRMLLEDTVARLPRTKLMICAPFVLPGSATEAHMDAFGECAIYAEIAERLAKEFGAEFLPLQGVFDEAAAKYGADVLLADGVHPTVQGAVLIAREWLKKFEKIEKEIQA